jgi:hypothetical protein
MSLKKYILVYFLVLSPMSYGQDWDPDPDPGFGGGSGDPATEPIATPIDGIEVPLFITGLIVAFLVLRKKQKQSVV